MKNLPQILDHVASAATLPAWAYRDPELFERVRERVFEPSWQLVADTDRSGFPARSTR